MSEQVSIYSTEMSGQKRTRGEDDDGGAKKRKVTKRTVDKWISENDKALQTMRWLHYETASGDREHVTMLKCKVCGKYKEKLISMRNYRSAFVEGTPNVRASTFKDHAATDMHRRAMGLQAKESASSIMEYAPIARTMAQASLSETAKVSIKKKFDIAYVMAKENFAFTKMTSLCELEERNGTNLGSGYKNDHSCATFIEFIARELAESLISSIGKCHFFSLQADGTTDSGNIENKLFMILYLDPYRTDGQVHIQNRFFTTRYLKCGTAEGLYNAFGNALEYMGLEESKSKLIGFGCDGTNVNIADGGLKGLLTKEFPWLVVNWCLSHRLELAIKDALKSTFFESVDELLLRLYYLYEKSPKKLRQLEEVVLSLKECLDPSELPHKGGKRPLRACGTRFVAHKVSALERVVDRYGAYISHLIALTEDSSVRAVEKQKLKGYIKQWTDAKALFGCAFFIDLLRPVAILCKVLQNADVCVYQAIDSLMKTKKALDKLKTTPLKELPSVKKVLSRGTEGPDGSFTYQGVVVKRYELGFTYLDNNYPSLVEAVEACLRKRLKAQNTDLLSDALTILATHGWERCESASFANSAIETVSKRFEVPLEKASVDISLLTDEWEDMVGYAKQYVNLMSNYKEVWWKLFNSPVAKQWSNILALVELLFCLPVGNGALERIFSQLKLIKTSHRTSLKEDTLDQLLRIHVEGPPLAQWQADGALELWLREKARRITHKETHKKRTKAVVNIDTSEDEEELFCLDDWDKWMCSSDDDDLEIVE